MAIKVLVVDDEPLIHRLLHHHLEKAGFIPLHANDGQEALEVVQKESPNLIVMDVMMAELDGLSTLRQLRKGDATKAIPVIIMTANWEAIVKQESEVAGASLFMTKPFSPAQLLAQIRKFIPENSLVAAA